MNLNRAKMERMRFIDFLVDRHGKVNRADIMDYFGVSINQAAIDFREYKEMAPNNLEYDLTNKSYIRATTFVRILP